jgi:uncharacterized protein (TIGR03086 family)
MAPGEGMRMDTVTMLARVVAEAQRVVDGVTPDQLSSPSPCEEWTVRDVINHITAGAQIFALSAELGAVPDEELGRLMGGDTLGDDYKGAFRAASNKALEVFEQPGMLDRTVTLPFGQMPASAALDIAVVDVATHTADVAAATGQEMRDDEMLEEALVMAHRMISPEWRSPGIFGPEQGVGTDASAADRLLAFAGRKV